MFGIAEYDEQRYLPACAGCGHKDCFRRQRVVHEVEVLSLEEGYAEVADRDMHVQDDWTFECEHCGRSGSELEDILIEREWPDEDDDDGLSDPDRYAEWKVTQAKPVRPYVAPPYCDEPGGSHGLDSR